MERQDFFENVASLLNNHFAFRIEELEIKEKKMTLEIEALKLKIKNNFESTETLVKKSEIFKIAKDETISENLYEKAKKFSLNEFTEYCDKILLQEKISINKMLMKPVYVEWENNQLSKHQEKEMMFKINNFIIKSEQEKELNNETEEVIKLLKLFIEKLIMGSEKIPCNRLCCKDQEEIKVIKTSLFFKKPEKIKSIYQNKKSEEYFDRYYRTEHFNLSNFMRLSQTKSEEMEELVNTYRQNLSKRKRY